MCGLVGIYSDKRAAHLDESLLRLLEHRGPDDAGYYRDPQYRLHLGFRRLAIIDLETGEQPVSNEDGSVVVVLNGEIYNYVELTRELKRRGHRFRSRGDAEVLVHLYEDEGDELLERLQGMFAFVLWDAKKGRLLIARDHAGIKPLYYAHFDFLTAFASEMKPLLRMSAVSREIDPHGLNEYLTFGYTIAPRTILRDIRKLPSGHKMVVHDGSVEQSSFWDIRVPAVLNESPEQIKEQVIEKMDGSVLLHLRSDVPVGAFLSGGVDSGLMVARAARLHPRLRTYTLRFEGAPHDESVIARSVSEKFGTDHREFTVTRDGMRDLLPRIAWACDEPLADSGVFPNYVISRLARADGVKVVLNGAGGDELFAGYTYFFRSKMEQRLHRWRVPLTFATRMSLLASRELARKLLRAASYETDPASHYLGHVTVWPETTLRLLLEPDFVVPNPSAHRRLYVEEFQGDHLNKKLYADLKTYLSDDLMLLLDRMTMIHSLEGRVPYLHKPLIELAMAIPDRVKAPNGERKGLLRLIAATELPPQVLQQPKTGFNSPIRQWIRTDFGDQVVGLLLQPRSLTRPWWNRRRLHQFLTSHSARRSLHHRLFVLFMLELFCRIHLDEGFEREGDVPPLSWLA